VTNCHAATASPGNVQQPLIVKKLIPFIRQLRQKMLPYRVLIRNFSYLSSLQVIALLIPVLTYPYLIRVLGAETYGLVLYAQAVVSYFTILVSFGFNVSATKEIAVHRHNSEKVSEIVSAVLLIKGMLTLISLIILLALLLLFPRFNDYKLLYLLSFSVCINDFLFPIWYFQGMERMKHITWGTVLAKLSFLVLMFFLIHEQEDYLFVPALTGFGALLSSGYALYFIFVKDRVKFRFQSPATLLHYTKDSFLFFTTSVSITIYSGATRIIIGSALSLTDLSYYDLADKVVSLVKLPFTIVGQTVLPRIAYDRNKTFIRRLSRTVFILSVAAFLITLLVSKQVVLILAGPAMAGSVVFLNILAIGLLPAMYKYIGLQVLATWGYVSYFFRISLVMLVTFTLIMLFLALAGQLNLYTVTVTNVAVELAGAICYAFIIKKHTIL
ncbi:MAG: oligosaccharide flippase family protein, partial [Mangrovibacterium sp.]|nr:oligosaccharide flippase family protein [Mangrovibacterium sp.]